MVYYYEKRIAIEAAKNKWDSNKISEEVYLVLKNKGLILSLDRIRIIRVMYESSYFKEVQRIE